VCGLEMRLCVRERERERERGGSELRRDCPKFTHSNDDDVS